MTRNGGGQLLESFLPVQLLSRLHAAGRIRPSAVEFPAAVMFVDVSRYTALVEQLARRGKEGLEKIPSLLNLSYSRSVEMVYDRGGEVLHIVGDAMLAYWPADSDGLGSAVQAAADCAEAICGNRRDLPGNEQNEIGPALHVGIGAGPLWVAALGGQPVWSLIAGGEAVLQASQAQTLAHRWEYVLSPAAKLSLGAERTNPAWSTPAPAPPGTDWLADFLPLQLRNIAAETASIHDADSHTFMAVGVQDRRTSVRLDALADVRPVTALFARILGIDSGDSKTLARYQKLCVALQEVLLVRGGPAGELFFDDKGLVFTATFGAPGTFHRDDPERAVDAACAIAATVRNLGLTTSVGVATGDALFRVVGNARRRQLMVLGEPLNRAARMMTAIAQGVLCDAPTERKGRDAFLFEQHGSLQLDGLGDMAAVFRPLERRVAAESATKLVGRQNELAFLRRTFEETHDGGKRLVVVLGESGIGKSALVNTFTDGLSIEGVAVSVAQAERDDRRTSLRPWRRVIASLLNISADSDGLTVVEQIADRVRNIPSLVSRLPLLDGFLGIEIAPTEGTRHLDGAHRADATMRLLGDLIGALAPQPVVMVLEDSQWLDSASWRLVEWVLASQSSMLLLLCVRPEEVPEELKSLLRRAESARMNISGGESSDPARFVRILDLEELSDGSICELVSLTLGDVPPDEDLARRVAVLADGNPFFAEEITLTLKSEGLIAVRNGRWRPIQPLDGLQYFEGVERVIRERIDRLDSTAQDVIRAASVVGRSFTMEALAPLLGDGSPRQEIETAVESLVDSRLVRQGSSASPGYEFRHDQIRDVVYGSIPSDLRQRFHGALATWMESDESDPIISRVTLLVQHFEAARNREKAIKYADLAATEALQIGAFREVEAFLGICFSHESRQQPTSLEQRLQAVRWRRQLAEAHYSRGDIHAQGVWVRRALTLAGEAIPRSKIVLSGQLLGNAVQLALQQIFLSPGVRSRTGPANLWEREMARCMNQAAMVDYFELRFLQGMRHLVRAVTLAEHTGLTIEMAVSSAQLACGLGIMGHRRACDYFMARAERTAIALGDPAIHSHVCNLDALWRIGHCDWSIVDRRLDQSQDLCIRAGDQLRWCNAQVIRFWALYYRGEWGVLEQTAQALLSRAQNSGNIQQELWALRCKSLCALHTNNPREAVEVFRLITSAMLGSADLAAQVSSKGALALARTGQHTESIQVVEECLHLLREMPRPTAHSTLVGISGVCEVLLRGREAGLSREYDQWVEWERQALHELNRYSRIFPVGRPQLGLWTGVAEWLDGRKALAFSTWRNAMALAKRLSLRQDEAMIAAELRRRLD